MTNQKIKRIDYAKHFLKQLKKAPSNIKTAFKNRFQLFLNNRLDPILRDHALIGTLKGYRSFNVNGDWRAVYSEIITDNEEIIIILQMIGTHSQLYR